VEVLRREQARVAAIGDAWVFDVEGEPLSRQGVRSLWRRIAANAGIPDGEGHGWHTFRRSFANRLRHVSLRDVKDLGGWKSEQTVVRVYQQPSESAQREALLSLGSAPKSNERAPGTGTNASTSQNEILAAV
jgi:integrase